MSDHQPDCASAKPQNLLQRHGMGGRILGGKYQSFYPAYGCVFRADHSGSGNSCHLAYPDEEKELKDKKRQKQKKEGCFPRPDELVPIDEIGPGFIVTNGGKKFIVVLKCGGSDFYTKPIGEKVRVQK